MIETGRLFVFAIYRSDPSIRLFATVNSVAGQVLSVTVPSGGVFGSGGPYANWLVIHAAFLGTGATAAEIWAGLLASSPSTPKSFRDSAVWVPITYAGTLTVAVSGGFARNTVITGSPTIAAPTGAYDRAPLSWKFEMGSGGGSPSCAQVP